MVHVVLQVVLLRSGAGGRGPLAALCATYQQTIQWWCGIGQPRVANNWALSFGFPALVAPSHPEQHSGRRPLDGHLDDWNAQVERLLADLVWANRLGLH